MKVAVFQTEDWEQEACRRLQPAHEVSCTRDALNALTAPAHADAQVLSPFVHSKLIETTLDNIEAFARGEPRNVVAGG